MVKGKVSAGQNVLITGIGGGVALLALQLCVAKGANVYVTSGDEKKVRKAIELGAKGGANYKDSKPVIFFAMSFEADNVYSPSHEQRRLAITNISSPVKRRKRERRNRDA